MENRLRGHFSGAGRRPRITQMSAFAALTILLYIMGLMWSANAAADQSESLQGPPAIIVNGQPLETDVDPLVENERLLVPARAVCEALGAEMQWDGLQQKVTAIRGDDVVELWPGQNQALKNGTPLDLDTEPRIVNERVLVPLRFVADALGARVEWIPEAWQALITLAAEEPAPAIEREFNYSGIFGPGEGTEKIPGNAAVAVSGITLQNLVIEGDLYIMDTVGDGDVSLNNVIVSGRLVVCGGGADSIHIDGGQYSSIVVEQTPSGQVRIVAVNTAGIPLMVSEDAAGQEIILEGNFDIVEIKAPGVLIKTRTGTAINKVTVDPGLTGVGMDLAEDSGVASLVVNSPVNVTGTGSIQTVSGTQAQESSFDVPPIVPISDVPAVVSLDDVQNPVIPVSNLTVHLLPVVQSDSSASISISSEHPYQGQTVTITINDIPVLYEIKALRVTPVDGSKANITQISSNVYTFVMPSYDVYIYAQVDPMLNPVIAIGNTINPSVLNGTATVKTNSDWADPGEKITVDVSNIQESKHVEALAVIPRGNVISLTDNQLISQSLLVKEEVAGSRYSFTMPDASVDVYVILHNDHHNVRLNISNPGTTMNYSLDKTEAGAGDTVTFKCDLPATAASVSISIANGPSPRLISDPSWDCSYDFVMPDNDVTIYVTVNYATSHRV